MQREMRSKFVLWVMLGLASVAFAKDHKPVQTGTLAQMETVPCAAAAKQTQDALCPEYLLQAERTTYRIRPRDAKHAALLPVGETVQFRLEKDKMQLRVEDIDSKERQYIVVSMTPRSDSIAAGATPVRLNHLQ
jgi:hypothetical protein